MKPTANKAGGKVGTTVGMIFQRSNFRAAYMGELIYAIAWTTILIILPDTDGQSLFLPRLNTPSILFIQRKSYVFMTVGTTFSTPERP